MKRPGSFRFLIDIPRRAGNIVGLTDAFPTG